MGVFGQIGRMYYNPLASDWGFQPGVSSFKKKKGRLFTKRLEYARSEECPSGLFAY